MSENISISPSHLIGFLDIEFQVQDYFLWTQGHYLANFQDVVQVINLMPFCFSFLFKRLIFCCFVLSTERPFGIFSLSLGFLNFIRIRSCLPFGSHWGSQHEDSCLSSMLGDFLQSFNLYFFSSLLLLLFSGTFMR